MIQEDVCRRLEQEPQIDASKIEVRVEQGVLTMRGEVPNDDIRRLAEDIAGTVYGITDLRNELRSGAPARR